MVHDVDRFALTSDGPTNSGCREIEMATEEEERLEREIESLNELQTRGVAKNTQVWDGMLTCCFSCMCSATLELHSEFWQHCPG